MKPNSQNKQKFPTHFIWVQIKNEIMATSANVVEYTIIKNGKEIGYHRQHLYCNNILHELLEYQPLKDHTIQPYGYDEEDELWEGTAENLEEFLKRNAPLNKIVHEYFKK